MHLPPQQRQHHDILEVFATEKASEHGFLRVSAPMVRYSKLEFRKLLRQYGVKLSFTPMIIADSFNNSQKARENEFTSDCTDEPVIAQFAAKNADEFVVAAQLIYPYVDGIDLNCGCPQSWAIAKGYGCGLLRQPELVRDIVQRVRRTLPNDFSISVKIRLLNHDNVRSTVELARQLEACGCTFLTIHGRTAWQRTSEPLNVQAMADLKQSLQLPLIVNGNVRSWDDACALYTQTKADGVMAARGLLSNPCIFDPLYKNFRTTPMECIQQWLQIAKCAEDNLSFQCFHHHLTFMCSSLMKRKLRTEFNSLSTKQEIYDFFEQHFDLSIEDSDFRESYEYTNCTYEHYIPPVREIVEKVANEWTSSSDGKFFTEFNREDDDEGEEDELIGSLFEDSLR